MVRVRSRLACLVLGVAVSTAPQLTASPARAAEPAAAARDAEQLANDAYQQHAAGHYGEAISSYLKAFEISKAGVVLFNVATIYDRKLHERALAEEYYRRYLSARDAEPELVKKATDRLTALKLEDEQAAQKAASVQVSPIPSASATPAPAPTPSATAPGPAATSPASPSSEPTSNGQALRTAGLVVGAVGIAGVGASMIFGLVAKGKNDDANAACNGAACPTEQGLAQGKDAVTFATVSTISFIAGLALVGGGASMYFLAPHDSPASPSARLTVSPLFGATSAGMSVRGSF